ncbi:MAG: hypothetical protein EJNHJLOP_00051 [Methanophagales virus PBV082]|uniref:Thymidylate synthase/dCMP hydroxymethylase domain-containing protein n=1 Tax=Methanophagales virus PBV082 TaxID=3071307 RepID=A0AA46YJ83_9VIRU|nr:MAG: hypothetical protein QIT52_gp51 [Methanophagales virus PBV082]UYL64940.1 MAG: hypothetical protein EJNHJLOP_00051 [Methanophagales virus PBV082]
MRIVGNSVVDVVREAITRTLVNGKDVENFRELLGIVLEIRNCRFGQDLIRAFREFPQTTTAKRFMGTMLFFDELPQSSRVREQLHLIVRKLEEKEETKKACISVIVPEDLEKGGYMPSLAFIQFMVREKKVKVFATFRSLDLLNGGIWNLLGLERIAEYVSTYINSHLLPDISVFVTSAHVYHKDFTVADKIVRMCRGDI